MAFPLPQFIQLYPTHRCNQGCTFCFNSPCASSGDMSLDKAMHLLDIILKHGIFDLDIMGGEPFLLPWTAAFIHAAVEKGIMVNISTNGSFPEVMQEFRGLSPENINIGISLEGSSAEAHGRLTGSNNYAKALACITGLVALGLNPIVKTVVTRETAPDIRPVADLLKELGVKRYYLIHMDLLQKPESGELSCLSYPQFLNIYNEVLATNHRDMQICRVNASCFEKNNLPEGVRCAGGVKKLSVMPDGSVYPCNLFQHFHEFRLGNIFTEDLKDIWQHPVLDIFRRAGTNSCPKKECENFSSCTGGCAAHAVFHTGKIAGSDIRCHLHK